MNLIRISGLLTAISSFSIAAFMLLYGEKNKPKSIFSCMCLCTGVWGLGSYMFTGVLIGEMHKAFLWGQFAYTGVIFIPIFYSHFIFSFLKLERKILILLMYFLGCIFVLSNWFWPKLFLTDFRFMYQQFYWHDWIISKSLIYLLFYVAFYLVLLAYSFFLLIKGYLASSGSQKHQLKYFIIASILGWVGGECNFLIDFGINIYPLPNFLIGIYPFVAGYSIIRYEFLDIKVVLKKGVVYSVLATAITAVYFILVLLLGKFFQGVVGYESFFINLIVVFIIAVLFNPLRDAIQHFLDKRFFEGTLESLAFERRRLQQELYHKEKLAYVGQLASSVAHEIRNPLTAIQTFIEYLPKKYEDKEFREKFEQIVPREIGRIQGVVNNLLDLAKPKNLLLSKTDIPVLIDLTLELLADQIALKNIQVKKEYSNKGVSVEVDDAQMKQVFLNLFLNSIQAMSDGGILSLRTTLHGGRFTIFIEDTGCGMSESQLKSLFTPFETTKETGVGLGLVITQEIIKAHGGTIAVESKLGQGTRFIIQLKKEIK
ncbi:MAG: hypothetical protein HQL24_07265 [Candidatus Omnitrophica bacterium]|nr:hypothetical protein [Candidatus Omnitrophota bacterium]